MNSFLSANSIQFYSHLFCSASILLQWHSGQLRAPGRCVCVFVLGGLTWETNSDLSERNEWINKRTCAFPCKYRRMCVNEPGRHGKAVVTCEWMCVCVCVAVSECVCWHGNTRAGISQGNASCLLPPFYQSQFTSCLGALLVRTVAPLSPHPLYTRIHPNTQNTRMYTSAHTDTPLFFLRMFLFPWIWVCHA